MAFWRLYYHLVWTTKNREPFIQAEIEPRLYAYLVNKAAELGCFIYRINGWYDHIHIIVAIPPKHAVAEVVKHLKGASSYDLNHGGRLEYQFAWQRGYGALSLGERQRPQAEDYVANQKTHHQAQTAIPWLERDADFDEGPSDDGIAPGSVPPVLREPGVAYSLDEEAAF